jgi:hypothetical protein
MNPPKTTQRTFWTRAALYFRIDAATSDLLECGGAKKRLRPGQAAQQLECLDRMEAAIKQLRPTLFSVVKSEAERAFIEGEIVE